MKVMTVLESDVDQEVLVLGKENPKEEWNRKDHDKIWMVARVLCGNVAMLNGNRMEKEPSQDGL